MKTGVAALLAALCPAPSLLSDQAVTTRIPGDFQIKEVYALGYVLRDTTSSTTLSFQAWERRSRPLPRLAGLRALAILAALWLAADCSSSYAAPGQQCLPCHSRQVEAFRKTGMGRSVDERPVLPAATFFHRTSNRHYAITGSSVRRHQVDRQGQQINVIEKPVTFAIGSGNHAITYISRTPQGRLLELPVSYYAKLRAYAMSPGYDRPDHPDFRREISDSCLACHSGSREPSPIDCERCHGDTAAHLAQPSKGTIVNPAALPLPRQLDLCLQCHLETASSGLNDSLRIPGRDAFSYKPGEPLANYKLFFDRVQPVQQAVAENPDHALAWFNLGVTHEAIGNKSEALRSYTEAIRLQPDSADGRHRRQMLVTAGQ